MNNQRESEEFIEKCRLDPNAKVIFYHKLQPLVAKFSEESNLVNVVYKSVPLAEGYLSLLNKELPEERYSLDRQVDLIF